MTMAQMLILWACLMALWATVTPLSADQGLPSTIDPDYFEVKPEVLPAPGAAWATPLVGGPVRTVVIGPVAAGSELAQLQRRLEMDARTVVVKPTAGLPEGAIGFPTLKEGHYNNVAGFSQQDMTAKLGSALEGDCELIIVGNVDWSILPEGIQTTIEQKVGNGAGLLLAHQSAGTIMAWAARLTDVQSQPIASATIPWTDARGQIIAEVPDTKRGADTQVTGTLDQGRVTILKWAKRPGDRTVRLGVGRHAVTGSWPLCQVTRDGWSYEYQMAAVVDAALWAAGRETPWQFISVEAPQASAIGKPVTLDVVIEAMSPTASAGKLVYQVRDLSNTIIERGSLPVSPDNAGHVSLPIQAIAPAGTYGVDLTLMQGGEVSDFAGAVIEVTSDARIAALELEATRRMPGDAIRGTVRVDDPPANARVRLEVFDAYGRMLGTSEVALSGAATPFAVDVIESLSAYNQVRATLITGKGQVDRASTHGIVDRRDRIDKNYLVSAWLTLPSDYLTTTQVAGLADLGFDTLYHPHYFKYPLDYLRRGSWGASRAGLNIAPYIWRDYAYAERGLRDLHREPCLSSPAYHKSMRKRLTPYAQLASDFAAPYASLGDEPYLVHFWTGVNGRDVCFAPDCQASFRVWLKDRYASLAALNQQWGTEYAQWGRVEPMIYQDALDRGNLSPWIDHRRHMTEVLQRMWRMESQVIREVDPRMPAGPEGILPWDPFKGYQFEQMASLGFVGPYGPALGGLRQLQAAQLAAFRNPQTNARMITIAGWYNTTPRSREYSWSNVWWPLFHGYNGLTYFTGNAGSTMSGVTTDYRPVLYLRDTLDAVQEIQNGLFRLIDGATRQDTQIAILYSQASYLASSLLREPMYKSLSAKQAVAWMRLLNDLGLPHTHVSTAQIKAGVLRNGIQVLILPAAIALSDREVEQIRRFVENGGVLVGDVLPAVLDGHGKPRDTAALDRVFGIEHQSAALIDLHDPQALATMDMKQESIGDAVLATATAAATAADHPLFTTHRFGQGQALLTNTTLHAYAAQREAGTNRAFATFVGDWLHEAGVEARFKLSSPEADSSRSLELLPFRDGTIEYLAVMKQPEHTTPGDSGFHIQLPDEYYVYDVRAHQALGRVDQLQGQCSGANPRVFALLPYEVTGVRIDAMPKTTAAGQPVTVAASVAVSEGAAGRHVLRINVAGPDGPRTHYTQVVDAPAGHGAATIPLAWNDTPGTWTMTITDVVSGESANISFDVTTPGNHG